MFHPNGAVEVKFHATGYISSSFLFGAYQGFGNRVGPHTLGTVHTHSAHYKVDLDVAGESSWQRGQCVPEGFASICFDCSVGCPGKDDMHFLAFLFIGWENTSC